MTWLPDAAIDRLRDVADFPVPPTDRYEIVEPIARGGMGTVYRGRDRELERIVAIKVLSAVVGGTDLAARMQQEARILARLEHPGIVPIYDAGVLDDGRVFYVMKLVQGPRLDQHAPSCTLVERLRLFTRICEPVAFAHAHGVVHRDLKPENVMVGPFGELLVLDWGAAQTKPSKPSKPLQIANCRLQIGKRMPILERLSKVAQSLARADTCLPNRSKASRSTAERTSTRLAGSCTFCSPAVRPTEQP